ncbi:serine hydrolase domain-containing protein [Streptomyces sp. NPDC101160]|uniref:serine hydrolase domain-containing protein n=1 Tax=Streptomyces sp. NPDC101160 TaxID=3366118 RepID=UPI0037F38EC4
MTNAWTQKARWLTAAAMTALVVAGAVVPASAAPPPGAAVAVAVAHGRLDPDALRGAMAGLPDDYVRGAMVSVSGRDGRWSGTAGEWTGPVDSAFATGSITKLFTSTVVLQLVGEGRLSLDDTVQELLPGLLPSSYAPITVGQLLSHTSGLQKPVCVHPGTPEEVVRSAVSCGTPTAPGTAVQYNGVNYFLAGLVVEKVTGRSYGAELRDRVLRPLGLRHTALPTGEWAWAEGGLVSDSGDLRRFFTSLIRGGLLRPEQRRLLFELPAVPGANFSYGGLMAYRLDSGLVVWGKTGSLHGHTSGIFATPDLVRVAVYSMLPTGKDGDQEVALAKRLAAAAFEGVTVPTGR